LEALRSGGFVRARFSAEFTKSGASTTSRPTCRKQGLKVASAVDRDQHSGFGSNSLPDRQQEARRQAAPPCRLSGAGLVAHRNAILRAVTLNYRVATPEEAAHYTDYLYPLQDRVFGVAASYGEDLILTGDTALARLHFRHRFSDDIDLFTSQPQAGRLGRDLANALVHAGFDVEPVHVAPDFFRCMVSDGVTRVQVDIAPDSPRVEPPIRSTLGVFAHSLRDIAANKISAYENRVEVKDAVDLYYLSRTASWAQMFTDAELKRVPIAFEDLRHFFSQPLCGEALLTRDISVTDFDDFVDTLRTEIAREINKKVISARLHLEEVAQSLLWDTPPESRNINDRTRAVLERRAQHLPLPQRLMLLEALSHRQ
jgi:hypothetical protein